MVYNGLSMVIIINSLKDYDTALENFKRGFDNCIESGNKEIGKKLFKYIILTNILYPNSENVISDDDIKM